MKSEDNTLVMDRTMAAPGGGRREDGLTPGDVLGQYRIVRSLGRGGMGEAYEAEHQVLRRRYALKLLHRGVEGQGVSLERFQLEAQVMANLEHPNIIRVDDFGETAGRFWLRMELAEGLQAETTDCQPISLISLKELADAHQGRLPQDLLLTILRQVLAGLDYAHHHGAVHRDIKPANILFQRSVVKIADFGLVKLVGEEWIRSRAEISVRTSLSLGSRPTMQGDAGAESGGTSTRALLGTYEYMSPEQKQGGAADARSDLYAVGVMAYRLLTGRNIGPKAPSRIDPSLAPAWDDFVEQALEENPEERLTTAADALRLLDAVEVQIGGGAGGVDHAAGPRRQPHAPASQTVQAVKSEARQAGDVQAVDLGKGVKLELVWCPPGTFMMGSPETEPGRSADETQHAVTLTKGFWMGKYPVTQAQWVTVMGKNPSFFNEGKFLGLFGSSTRPELPVESVSWDDCQEFIRKVNAKVPGGGFRLPTEAEWEYAAKGGSKSKGFTYAGGNDIDTVAWHGGNSGTTTHPVGKKAANELGLHDMSGNVWEWCADWYQNSYSGLPDTDPKGPGTGSLRVFRGGSWINGASRCRSADRNRFGPSFANYDLGFRVVLAPVP